MRVPRSVLAAAVDKEVAARREQIRQTFGDEATLAAEVERAYGLDVEHWRREILWPRIGRALLMERVVRTWSRSQPRLIARVIVVSDLDRAQRVMRKLQAGADFSLVARQESLDETRDMGGTLPPISPGTLTVPGLEKRLFEAAAGALVGPLPIRLGDQQSVHIYKVIEHQPAWAERGEAFARRLEAELATKPVGRGEFERWRAAMRRQQPVGYRTPDGRPYAR